MPLQSNGARGFACSKRKGHARAPASERAVLRSRWTLTTPGAVDAPAKLRCSATAAAACRERRGSKRLWWLLPYVRRASANTRCHVGDAPAGEEACTMRKGGPFLPPSTGQECFRVFCRFLRGKGSCGGDERAIAYGVGQILRPRPPHQASTVLLFCISSARGVYARTQGPSSEKRAALFASGAAASGSRGGRQFPAWPGQNPTPYFSGNDFSESTSGARPLRYLVSIIFFLLSRFVFVPPPLFFFSVRGRFTAR